MGTDSTSSEENPQPPVDPEPGKAEDTMPATEVSDSVQVEAESKPADHRFVFAYFITVFCFRA